MKQLYLLLLLLLLFCSLLSAQEICDNGIDDDGDGAIDLLDTECICTSPVSSIIDDFEDYTCCPETLSGGPVNGYNCLISDWIEGVQTPDYYNLCGFVGFPSHPMPQPLPSGAGAIGFRAGLFGSFIEGIARCLSCTLQSGQNYDISLFVGFDILSFPQADLTLYGKSDCNNLSTIGGCPNSDWTPLVTLSSPEVDGSTWVQVVSSFTAPFDIAALLLVPDCDWSSEVFSSTTVYIDLLEISGSFGGPNCPFQTVVTTSLSGGCVEGYFLSATADDAVGYQWYLNGVAITGATSSTWLIEPLVGGDYQVLATFSDGTCAISDPTSFDPDFEVLNIDAIVTNPACFGETTGSIELIIDSPNSAFEIQWSSGSTESVLEDIGVGTYFVTVTDTNGCFGAAEFILSEPLPLSSELTINQPVAGIGGEASIVSTGGTPPYQYNWSNGAEGAAVTNLLAGSYSVIITDSNGCTELIDFEILAALQVDIIVTPEDCVGNCNGTIEVLVGGGIEPYAYVWDIPGESNVQENLCAGVYQFTVVDGVGTTYTQEVLLEAAIAINLILEETEVRCSSTDLTVLDLSITGGQSPYSIAWSTGAVTEDLLSVGVGVYDVSVTDANGCTSVENYTVEPYNPRIIDFTTRVTNCTWDEFQLVIENSFVADLTFFLNEEIIDLGPSGNLDGLASGNYEFSYEDANGCIEEIGVFNLVAGPPYEVYVDESQRNMEYGQDLTLEILVAPTSQLLLDNEITWSTLNSFSCLEFVEQECTQIQLNATEPEIVRVRFRDENGCEQLFTVPVQVEIPDYIYVPNVFSPNGDGLNDDFRFFVTDFVQSIPQVQIFNRWGALIYESYDQEPSSLSFWNGRFQGQRVNPGVYLYTITLELATGERVLVSGDITVIR